MHRFSRFAAVAASVVTLAATAQLASCSSDDDKKAALAALYDAGAPELTLSPADAGIFVKGAQQYVAYLSLPNDPAKKPRNDAGEIPPRDPPKQLNGADLAWTSSDTAVATINELGRATAAKAGDTLITAKMKSAVDGGGQLSATAALNVKNPGLYQSVRVEPATQEIAAGALFQFKALGKPFDGSAEKDVTAGATWSSSSPAVATIDALGKARGICAGTVKIIATVGVVESEPAQLTVTGCVPDSGTDDGGAGEGGTGDGGDEGGAGNDGSTDAAGGG